MGWKHPYKGISIGNGLAYREEPKNRFKADYGRLRDIAETNSRGKIAFL